MPSVYFKTNVQLKNVIGKELINNDNIAILELVKNSYDAGSPTVTVEFHHLSTLDTETPFIIITDAGSGMSLKDVKDKWLNIAHSAKKEKKVEGGRILAGAKGIGRFSCDRLGEKLKLFSCKRNSSWIALDVDWTKFEIEGDSEALIEKVPIECTEGVDAKKLADSLDLKLPAHGTVLLIQVLRSPWDEEKLMSLRRYLERLTNPNQSFMKGGFKLALQVPGLTPELSGPIVNQIFGRLEFTSTSIEAVISDDGKSIVTTLRDKGREVFELKERNELFKNLKDVRVVIYYLNQYGKAYFKKQTGLDKVKFGSIFLFINGFRIAPYGDEGDDWLGLDRFKAQGYARNLGAREVIGRVEIMDPDREFRIISSREGVVHDARFEELVSRDGFYYQAHKRLENFVVDGIDWDSAPDEHVASMERKMEGVDWVFNAEQEIYGKSEKLKRLSTLENLNSVLSIKRERLLSVRINPDLLKEIAELEREKAEKTLHQLTELGGKVARNNQEALAGVRKVLEKQKKQLEKSHAKANKLKKTVHKLKKEKARILRQNLFLKAASTAEERGFGALQHHIAACSFNISQSVKRLRRAIDGEKPRDQLIKLLAGIEFENRKIATVARCATRAVFDMKKEQITEDIIDYLGQYLNNVRGLKPRLEDGESGADIEFVNEAGVEHTIEFDPIDLIMLTDNLVSNAEKANAKLVRVVVEKNDGQVKISFMDNGDGVESDLRERIFEYGFSTTDGTGIGLYHSRDIARRLGAKLQLAKPHGTGSVLVLSIPMQ